MLQPNNQGWYRGLWEDMSDAPVSLKFQAALSIIVMILLLIIGCLWALG